MATTTWDDVDAIAKMKKAGKPYSLMELELALAGEDHIKVKTIISAMRGPSGEFTAAVYPFGGVKLTVEIQRKRCQKWFNEGEIIYHIYTLVQTKAKDAVTTATVARKEAEAEALKAEVEELKAEKKEAEKAKAAGPAPSVVPIAGSPATPPMPKVKAKPKKTKPTINIRDQIKFEQLKLNDEHISFVPTEDNFYEFPGWTIEFTKLFDRGMNMWLYGGTGAGKSSLVEQVCAIGKMSLIYQSFHEDIKPDSLFGGKELVDGNTVWQDGPVTKAYREGHVLLLDEIDGTPPEILFCLFAILDRKPLVLADNGCEIIKPHKNFRVVATGNTLGRGDETGSYSGTNVLNRAFLNRFRVWYNVEYPSEDVYRKIIMKEGVTESVAKVIARLAREINAAAMAGTLTETFSLRDAREVSKTAEILDGDIRRALQLTLLNRLSNVEQAAINEMFRRLVPDSVGR